MSSETPQPAPGLGGLVWSDLTEKVLARLNALEDPEAKILVLTEAMNVKHYQDNSRSAILVDFLFYCLVFCDENGFSLPKKSALFSIMKLTFAHAFEGPESVSADESLAFF